MNYFSLLNFILLEIFPDNNLPFCFFFAAKSF